MDTGTTVALGIQLLYNLGVFAQSTSLEKHPHVKGYESRHGSVAFSLLREVNAPF